MAGEEDAHAGRRSRGDPNRSVGCDRRSVLAMLGAGPVAATAGCFAGGDPGEVTFGQPAALSGRWAHLQPGVTQATDLAVAAVEEAGGPLDVGLTVQRRDTRVDPERARTVAGTLVDDDGAVALVGLFGREVLANVGFLEERAVPVVSPWASTAGLDGRGGDGGTPSDLSDDEWIWRTIASDSVHPTGGAAALLADGVDQLGVLHTGTPGERFWAETVVAAFERGGGTIEEYATVEAGADEDTYHGTIHGVFEDDVDAWAFAAPRSEAATIVRLWEDHDYGGPVLLDNSLRDGAFLEATGGDATGMLFATATGKGPAYDRFAPAYDEAGDADLHPWAVAAFDAVTVAALALHRAREPSAEAVQRNLGPVARAGGTPVTSFAEGRAVLDDGGEISYRGAASPVDFTALGNVLGDVRIDVATADGFRPLDVVAAEDLPPLLGTH